MLAEAFSPSARSPTGRPTGCAGGAVFSRWSKIVLSSTPGCGRSNCAFTRPSARSARSRPFMQHGHQVAILHYARAELFGGGGVHVLERRAVRRRPHQPRVQQSRESEIGGVFALSGDLVQAVFAPGGVRRHRERRHRFQRHVGQVALDALAIDQFRVGDALAGRRGIRDHTRLHLQPLGGRLELFGGHLQQHRPRFGGGGAQGRG